MLITEAQKTALQQAAIVFAGHSLWLVGGWVRDALLARPNDDIDLAVSASPAETLALARRFSNESQRAFPDWHISYVPLDAENGVARLVFNHSSEHFYFDFAALGGTNLETDLARRDFTVNALAVPLDRFLIDGKLEPVIDVSGGLVDLQAKIIRPVSEANLISDPLRMLRGVRLRAQLRSEVAPEWDMSSGVADLFQRHAPLIRQTAGERIAPELNKTFLAGNAEESLRLLDSYGLFSQLIPELDEGKGSIQMPAHHYDVWNHNLVAVDRLEWLVHPGYDGPSVDQMATAQRPEEVIKLWPEMMSRLYADQQERLLWLYWGTLLHDVGKPRTRTVDTAGEIHFYEHQKIGAEMARQILSRLHFSRAATEAITIMVLHHLRPGQLSEHYDPSSGGGVTKRAIYKLLRDTEPVQIEMLPLSLADHAAVVGPWIAQARQLRSWNRHLHLTDKLAHTLLGSEDEKMVGKPRLLDGRALMTELSLPPGPILGQLLREIEEAQAVGEITNREQALTLARQLFQTRQPEE